MKWIVPGPNAKVLAQVIHCLAKLGEDLYIEGSREKLSFRTVNLSKTVFASFNFRPDFFSFYPVLQPGDIPRCQIALKAALVVFRFPSGMEKAVEHCAISLAPEDDVVVFRIKFKQGFVKNNKIQLIETEVLQASYEDEVLPSRIVIDPKVLNGFLSGFTNPEITWAVTEAGVKIRNFSELVDDGAGLRSEVYVSKEELLELSISSPVELTFCLAEVKTVLNFAEHVSCPIAVSFGRSGAPMFFIVTSEILIAHVVLSTFELSTSQSSSSSSVIEPKRKVFVLIESQSSQNLTYSQESLSQASAKLDVLRRVLKRTDYDITKLPGYDEVLAPDSDEEME